MASRGTYDTDLRRARKLAKEKGMRVWAMGSACLYRYYIGHSIPKTVQQTMDEGGGGQDVTEPEKSGSKKLKPVTLIPSEAYMACPYCGARSCRPMFHNEPARYSRSDLEGIAEHKKLRNIPCKDCGNESVLTPEAVLKFFGPRRASPGM